ncbi:hypothetical protein ABPG74_006441 [Tetrahymena malaccensis]
MLEEFNDMPIHPTHNILLSSKISDFVIKETKPIIEMQSIISNLLKETNIKKNIQIQFDNPQLENMRNEFSSNTLLQSNFYNLIDEEKREHKELKLINNFAHFEVYSDIYPQNYNETYYQETEKTEKKLPDMIKKIKKRVKIDLLRERFYLNRTRHNMTLWLYNQMKPSNNEEKQQNGKGTGQVQKQKLKRDLQSITNYDKKTKQVQQDPFESKHNFSHILNVQNIVEMQQSFFPPKATFPIKLYYPLKDNCCNENAIQSPSNKIQHIRMTPKKYEGYETHLALGNTFIIKIKNLLTFFQHVTQKGSDFVYISNQMDLDYFQIKVLYDYISKVFKLSKVHKEQRRKSQQKKDRVQVKMQEIKQHIKNIFKDLYEEQKVETIFQIEEVFVSYGDIQTRLNKYFHPESKDVEEEYVKQVEKTHKYESNELKKDKEREKEKEKEKDKDEDYNEEDNVKGRKRKTKQVASDVRANTRSNNQANKMLQLF